MGRRPRSIIPSQAPSRRVPFMPGTEQDVAQQGFITEKHQPGDAPAPNRYVVSTFDARPIMATDFQTQSGSNADDTGFAVGGGTAGPGGDAYISASANYVVPNGYRAILRDYHILTVPATGQDTGGGATPIFGPNGESNFRVSISILVDGIQQLGMSGLVSWAGAFGDIFGDCYVIAEAGSTIQLLVTCQDDNNSSFYQALLNMHGNLLLSKSDQLQYAPATNAVIPVENRAKE